MDKKELHEHVEQLIKDIEASKKVSISGKEFTVVSVERLEIDDKNDWITNIMLSDGNEQKVLEFVINEGTDMEFVGAFIQKENIHIDEIKAVN